MRTKLLHMTHNVLLPLLVDSEERIYIPNYHIKAINLIPFIYRILPFITGAAGCEFSRAIGNQLSNILLFVALRFYNGVCLGVEKAYRTYHSKDIRLFNP